MLGDGQGGQRQGPGASRPRGPPAAQGPRWRRVGASRQPGCVREKRTHRDSCCTGDPRAGNSNATCLQGPAHLQASLWTPNSSPSHPHPSALPPREKARAQGLQGPPKRPAELQPSATLPRGPSAVGPLSHHLPETPGASAAVPSDGCREDRGGLS